MAKTPTYEPQVERPHLIEHLDTDNAGTLWIRDEFEFKLNDVEGANYGHFIFHGLIEGPKGRWVNAFGGDAIRADKKHRRQWHALDVDRVVAEAKVCRATWRTKR